MVTLCRLWSVKVVSPCLTASADSRKLWPSGMGHVDPAVKAVGILADRFASIDAIGPAIVALYRRVRLGSPEADRVQALACARVDQLLRRLRAAP